MVTCGFEVIHESVTLVCLLKLVLFAEHGLMDSITSWKLEEAMSSSFMKKTNETKPKHVVGSISPSIVLAYFFFLVTYILCTDRPSEKVKEYKYKSWMMPVPTLVGSSPMGGT